MADPIMDAYKQRYDSGLYQRFCDAINVILDFEFNDRKNQPHIKIDITYRIKKEDSLTKKIIRKHNKYNYIDNINDVIGFRIVTGYQDSVNEIDKRLRALLVIDYPNSIDKREQTGNAFGYASLHLIASLPGRLPYYFGQNGESVPDVTEFSNLKFEIQIRTVLENVWATIEHGLAYKPNDLPAGLPSPIRRSLARLSAVLETADVEFMLLRDRIGEYTKLIKDSQDNTDYSKLTLISGGDPRPFTGFFYTSKMVARIEKSILELTKQSTINVPYNPHPEYFELLLKYGIDNAQKMHSFIKENENDIIDLAVTSIYIPYAYINGSKMLTGIPNNFGLDFVCMCVIAKYSKDPEEVALNLKEYMKPSYNALMRDSAPLFGPITAFMNHHQ